MSVKFSAMEKSGRKRGLYCALPQNKINQPPKTTEKVAPLFAVPLSLRKTFSIQHTQTRLVYFCF